MRSPKGLAILQYTSAMLCCPLPRNTLVRICTSFSKAFLSLSFLGASGLGSGPGACGLNLPRMLQHGARPHFHWWSGYETRAT